jgi:hypothetical protein
MKLALVPVILAALALSAPFAWAQNARVLPDEPSFEVQKLTPAELAKVTNARRAALKAQKELDAIEREIRQAHGEAMNGYPGDAVYRDYIVSVELRGAYALVTTMLNDPSPGWFAQPVWTAR